MNFLQPRKAVGLVLLISLLAPPFFLIGIEPAYAAPGDTVIFKDQATQPASPTTVNAQSAGVGLDNSSTPLGGYGIGQGVGSAVGNIGVCAGALLGGIGTSLGLGGAAIATATIVPSGLPVQDRAVFAILGGNLAVNTQTAVATATQTIIECFLNGLVVLLREVLIAQLTASIVNWINSGFNGNPAFVTDPAQFFKDVADQTIGEFIGGTGLSFVCSPFQLQLKKALTVSYGSTVRNACTLSKVVKNFQGFINGGFGFDGWDGWFAMANNPSNTLAGSYFQASSDLSIKIVNAQGQELNLLNWGGGFLSYKDPNTGKIVSPGSVLNNQLNQTLFSGQQRLAMASQINQIVGALVAQLVNHVFGSGGLLGMSRGSYGNSSPLDQTLSIANQENLQGRQNLLINNLQGAYQTASAFKGAVQDELSRVASSKEILTDTISCYRDKIKSNQFDQNQVFAATARIGIASTTIATRITPLENILLGEAAKAEKVQSLLAGLIGQANSGSGEAVLASLNAQYQSLLANGTLFSPQAPSLAAQQAEQRRPELEALDAESRTKLNGCSAFPQNIYE